MKRPKKLKKLPIRKDRYETIAIFKQLAISSNKLGELKGLAKTIPNQSILINAVVLQEAKDSSEIENIITTQDELYQALNTSAQHPQQIKEVINYRKAIFEGFKIVQKQKFLRLKDIETIQKIIVENNAGIRSLQGTVLKNDKTGEIIYTPPQNKKEILDLFDNFLQQFNLQDEKIHPLINLAILHHQFESIHPFYDGNGRTGRILNILFLILNDLLDIPILYLSSYINENKTDYYKYLNQVNQKDKWDGFILYILKAVEVTSIYTIEKILSIHKLLEKTIMIVKDKAPKIYSKDFIELLFENPYCKIDAVVKRLNIERKSASRHLKQLEEIGILKSQKIGREIIYINKNLIKVLKNT